MQKPYRPVWRARGTRRALVWTVLVGLLSYAVAMLDPRALSGVRIDGVPVPRSGSLTRFLEERARIWAEQSIRLETGYHAWQPTRRELGGALSTTEAASDISQVGRSINPIVALRARWIGAFGMGHDLTFRPRIAHERALDAYVERLRAQVDRLPTEGSLDGSGNVVEGLPGEALDVAMTKQAIVGVIRRGGRALHVSTIAIPPLRTLRRFRPDGAEATVPMMHAETTYRLSNQGRATNIELAARKLDGRVLAPSAGLSFNQVVGKRSASAGFAAAQELINGEVVLGIGGGVCQVAGTLHAAAFFAGLTIEEYRPHSRLNRFAYLQPGLDTMVAWPEHVDDLSRTKDMRIRNPYPFPVVVRTSLVREGGIGRLRVALFGAAPPFRVDFSFEEIERTPAPAVRRVDPTLRADEQRVTQEAHEGLVILRRRTIYMPTRRVEEVVRVSYPPTPRIVLVGRS